MFHGWEYLPGGEKKGYFFFFAWGGTSGSILSMIPVQVRQDIGVYLVWQALLSLEPTDRMLSMGNGAREVSCGQFSSRFVVMDEVKFLLNSPLEWEDLRSNALELKTLKGLIKLRYGSSAGEMWA